MPATTEPQPDESWSLDHLKEYVQRHGLAVGCGVGGKARRTKNDILADIRAAVSSPAKRQASSSPTKAERKRASPRDAERSPRSGMSATEECRMDGEPNPDWSLDQIKAFCRERGLDVRLNVGGRQSRTKSGILADVRSALTAQEEEERNRRPTPAPAEPQASGAVPEATWSMAALRQFVETHQLQGAVSLAVGGRSQRTRADIAADIRHCLAARADTETCNSTPDRAPRPHFTRSPSSPSSPPVTTPKPKTDSEASPAATPQREEAGAASDDCDEPNEAWSVQQLRGFVRRRGLQGVSCQVGGRRRRTKADILRDVLLALSGSPPEADAGADGACGKRQGQGQVTGTHRCAGDCSSDPDTDEAAEDSDLSDFTVVE